MAELVLNVLVVVSTLMFVGVVGDEVRRWHRSRARPRAGARDQPKKTSASA